MLVLCVLELAVVLELVVELELVVVLELVEEGVVEVPVVVVCVGGAGG